MRSVRSVLYQNEKNANAVSSPVPELEYPSPLPEFYGIGLRCLMTDGISIPAAQSTYIYRAPQCMSPRRNWDSPNPFAASECALPPGPKVGGAHPPAPTGVGEFQFRRWRKSLALCLLCARLYRPECR
jgi:hypothetical protein